MGEKSVARVPSIENIAETDLVVRLFMPEMYKEHELRYELLAAYTSELLNDGTKKVVVDMANGRGMGTRTFNKKIGDVTVIGLEKDMDYVKKAKEIDVKSKVEGQINYVNADVLEVPLVDNCADLVSMFEILEHVPKAEQQNLLNEASRLVKDDGLVLVSVPYPYSYNEKGERMGPSSNANHLYESSFEEVELMSKEAGFEVVTRFGQSFATQNGIDIAKKWENTMKTLNVPIPAMTAFTIGLGSIRDPKPVELSEMNSNKVPLTQIFVLKKSSPPTQ